MSNRTTERGGYPITADMKLAKDSPPAHWSRANDNQLPFAFPQRLSLAEAAKLKIRPDGRSDLPEYADSRFNAVFNGSGYTITRQRILGHFEPGQMHILSPAQMLDLRIRPDGRSERVQHAGTVFYAIPQGGVYKVYVFAECTLECNRPTLLTAAQAATLLIRFDGTSERPDLRDSLFDVRQAGDKLQITRRSAPGLPPRRNKFAR